MTNLTRTVYRHRGIVEAFGRLACVPNSETFPTFPDLNVLIFRTCDDNGVYTHTAVCIQLDLDVCGDSVDDVTEKIQNVAGLYFDAQARACSSTEDFVRNITDTVFSQSEERNELFGIYREAKRDYLMIQAQGNKAHAPRPWHWSMAPFMFDNKDVKLSRAMAN